MAEKISYRTSFGKAFHRTILVSYVFYVLYQDKLVVPPEGSHNDLAHKAFGGRFKYLTSINLMILQLGYFALAAINDLAGSNERVPNKASFLQRVRDFLFTTIIFPMAIYVSSIFWALYYYDRNLIFPESYESWYPSWVNHFEHSLPAGAVLLEMLLIYHKFPKSRVVKTLPMLVSFGAYFAWLLYLKFERNIFVYPFFEAFSDTGLVAFLLVSGIPGFVWILLGEIIHRFIWGADPDQKKKERSKSKNNTKQGNNKKGGTNNNNNKKQSGGGKKGKENQQLPAKDVNKKQKNPDLESAKKKQKIIEEPEKNKKKQKNMDSDKKKNPLSSSHQNFAKNKKPKTNQDTKNTKANKKTR